MLGPFWSRTRVPEFCREVLDGRPHTDIATAEGGYSLVSRRQGHPLNNCFPVRRLSASSAHRFVCCGRLLSRHQSWPLPHAARDTDCDVLAAERSSAGCISACSIPNVVGLPAGRVPSSLAYSAICRHTSCYSLRMVHQ